MKTLTQDLDLAFENGVVEFRLPSGEKWTGDKYAETVFPHLRDDGSAPCEPFASDEKRLRLPISVIVNSLHSR